MRSLVSDSHPRTGYTVTEQEIQQHFFAHIDHYLPGAQEVKRTDIAGDDRRGIPDGWVMYRGELCPVEVKQRSFGAWALQQLLGYLNRYQCRTGIAVCEHFTMTAKGSGRIVCVTVPVDRSLETATKAA